jgi:preprotein translocase subunit YajC
MMLQAAPVKLLFDRAGDSGAVWLGLSGLAQAEGVAPGGFAELFFGSPLGLMLLILLGFWLMVVLPQQRAMRRQQRELEQARQGLRKNDRVVTSGGLHGVVVTSASGSPTVTIRLDEQTGAKVTVDREAILRIVKDGTGSSEAGA